MNANSVSWIAMVFAACLVFAAAVEADVVELDDGRCIEGKVVAESDSAVTLAVGGGGRESFPRKKVKRVCKGMTLLDLYSEKEQAAGAEGALELGLWCERHGFKGLAVLSFRRAVGHDPSCAAAHERLGHALWEGKWFDSEEEMMAARGFVNFRGEFVARTEISARSAGFVEHEEDWFTADERKKMAEGRAVELPGRGKWKRVRTLHYRLFSTLPSARGLKFAEMSEQAYAAFKAHFGAEPSVMLEGDVFGALQDFEDFAVGSGMAMPGKLHTHGFFSGRKVHFPYVDDEYTSLNYLIHELCHQYDCLSGRPMNAPPWYFEGIACFFANHAIRDGKLAVALLVPSKNSNLYYLQHMIRTGKAWPLKAVLTGDPGPSIDRDFYNHAWGLVWFLTRCEKGGYPAKFKAYEEFVHSPQSAGKDLLQSFVEIIGPMETVEKDFLSYIASIKGIPWRGIGKPAGGK